MKINYPDDVFIESAGYPQLGPSVPVDPNLQYGAPPEEPQSDTVPPQFGPPPQPPVDPTVMNSQMALPPMMAPPMMPPPPGGPPPIPPVPENQVPPGSPLINPTTADVAPALPSPDGTPGIPPQDLSNPAPPADNVQLPQVPADPQSDTVPPVPPTPPTNSTNPADTPQPSKDLGGKPGDGYFSDETLKTLGLQAADKVKTPTDLLDEVRRKREWKLSNCNNLDSDEQRMLCYKQTNKYSVKQLILAVKLCQGAINPSMCREIVQEEINAIMGFKTN